jgi:membrane-associated phospholipid phosphatase
MISKQLFILVLALSFSNPVFSPAHEKDEESMNDSQSLFVQDATHFAEIGFGLLAAPFNFNGHDWVKMGLTVGTTALLFTTDKSMREFSLRNQSEINDKLFNMDSYQGNHYSLLVGLGFYGYGAIAGNSQIRKMGLYATEAFVYSGAITGIFKILIGRRRPYAGDSHIYFRSFQFTNDQFQALPSGHTTVSFAVSTALAKSLDNKIWKVFWYGTAGLVGASRIYHNKHWLSDVFLGGVIGYYVGDYIVGFSKKEKPQLFGKRIQPWIGLNTIGIRVHLK